MSVRDEPTALRPPLSSYIQLYSVISWVTNFVLHNSLLSGIDDYGKFCRQYFLIMANDDSISK